MAKNNFLMIDLGAGLGGASQAMKDNGWDVIRVDINKKFDVDIVADVMSWQYKGEKPDLIWFSMPCTEFARESMPWCKKGIKPDLTLILACLRIINEVNPKYWICENVKGAIKWFKPIMGNFRYHVGAFYLWGFFPDPGVISKKGWVNKSSISSFEDCKRAIIPYSLYNQVRIAIEKQQLLPGVF